MTIKIVSIGASAGGVDGLKQVLSGLKRPSNISVLVVLHFPPEGPNLLPEIYKEICAFDIKEAESGEKMQPETVYIAPPDYHLSAEQDLTLSLSSEDQVNFSRPSIDVLMDSVAVSFGPAAIGILLTGANHDGAQGMLRIHKLGGRTVVQDPQEAEYPAMPNSALELFRPTMVLTLKEINQMMSSFSGARYGKK